MSNIERLWQKHYIPGETDSFNGDMARAFARMFDDPDRDAVTVRKMQTAVSVHCDIEANPRYVGRKWFREIFA